ncbi:hypothetical protein DFP73DRAFT_346033 [Morchella snyderi]|nr:hypothetical protein DFP73DRAFT_346033 [Morchella snyderi]
MMVLHCVFLHSFLFFCLSLAHLPSLDRWFLGKKETKNRMIARTRKKQEELGANLEKRKERMGLLGLSVALTSRSPLLFSPRRFACAKQTDTNHKPKPNGNTHTPEGLSAMFHHERLAR